MGAWWIVGGPLSLLLAVPVLILLHECGHALAALCLTRNPVLLRFQHLSLARLSVGHGPRVRLGRLVIELPRGFPISGLTVVREPPPVSRRRTAAILAAGPLTNLVLAALAGRYLVDRWHEAQASPLAELPALPLMVAMMHPWAYLFVMAGVVGLLPLWERGVASDAWRLRRLLRGRSLNEAAMDTERRRRQSFPRLPMLTAEWAPWRSAFPDIDCRVTDVVTEPRRMELHMLISGTHQGVLDLSLAGLAGSMPPTGRRVQWRETAIVFLDEWHTPVSVRTTPHRAELLAQLGIAVGVGGVAAAPLQHPSLPADR